MYINDNEKFYHTLFNMILTKFFFIFLAYYKELIERKE